MSLASTGLHYAGLAGTGMTDKELSALANVLAPLQVPEMPLAAPPPRDSWLGSPFKLSCVHLARPEMVVEATYLTWTEDSLLRQVSYQGRARTSLQGRSSGRCPTRLDNQAGSRVVDRLSGQLRTQFWG
jgi:ATP-dependent DNA ligase